MTKTFRIVWTATWFFLFLGIFAGRGASNEPFYSNDFEEVRPSFSVTKGIHGNAILFQGEGGQQYLPIGDFGKRNQCTISFWVKPAPIASGDRKSIQGLVTADDWQKGVLHFAMVEQRAEAILHLGTETARARVASDPLVPETWHHLALTIDAEKGNLAIYHNGMLCNRSSFKGLDGILLDKQLIGAEQPQEFGRFFRGAIDEVRMYDEILSEKEIRNFCPNLLPSKTKDWRYVKNGKLLPDENYCDQPYVVTMPDGRWVCIMTTGPGHEGAAGQHIVACWSEDHGETWSDLIDVEPSGERVSAYAVPVVTDFGRIYAFYNFNTHNVREIPGKKLNRSDVLGDMCYRYSDDGGETWSQDRYTLPMRRTKCDFENEWGGEHIHFWTICKPQSYGDEVFFTFTKLQKYLLINGEGWMFHSNNLMRTRDVSELHWEMLPDGDGIGIRHPDYGSVQEEHNIVILDDGTIYCVYRTMKGFACISTSHDGGHTFSKPVKLRYHPDGRIVKTPRACPQIWKCENGKYLLWIKNHSNRHYKTRNPVWLIGGHEKNGTIHWSEPEILLYEDNPTHGMSYPDLIEENGRYWFVETQKYFARVHEVPASFLQDLWTQSEQSTLTREGMVAEVDQETIRRGKVETGDLSFQKTADAGFTLDFILDSSKLIAGELFFDARNEEGNGWWIDVAQDKTLQLTLKNDHGSMTWDTDPGLLSDGESHHVTAIVDANPKVILFVVDGRVCDGGEHRYFGWRSAAGLPTINEAVVGRNAIDGEWDFRLPMMPSPSSDCHSIRLGAGAREAVRSLRVYRRYLWVTEAISNYRSLP